MLTNYVPDPMAVGPQLLLQGVGASVTKVDDALLTPRGRSYQVRTTTASTGVARLPAAHRAPATEGEPWTASARVRFDPDRPVPQAITLSVEFFDAQGVVVGTASDTLPLEVAEGFYEAPPGSGHVYVVGPTPASGRSYPASLFQRTSAEVYTVSTSDVPQPPAPVVLRASGIAPEGAATASISVSGDSFYVTNLMLVQVAAEELPDFFTGASGAYYAWSGTPHASTSLYYQTYPQLVPRLDRSPVERVVLTFREVLPGATYVNVWRISDGRTTEVRGGLGKYAVGGFPLIDYEAPFGVPITYRAEMFTDATLTVSLGFTETATTQLDAVEPCVHQPLNPASAVWPRLMQGTADDIVRRTPGEMVYAEGAQVGTWLGQQRRGIEGLQLRLLTETLGDADRFQQLLQSVAVLCVRTPPPIRIPRTFFGSVDELHEVAFDVAQLGGSVMFEFQADEVRPPAPGLVPAILRRDDIDTAYATREQRAAAYLTRLDRDRDYSLAGLAG
jgi:hypothetical protein